MKYLSSKYGFFIIFILWFILIILGFRSSDVLGYFTTVLPILFLGFLAD